MNARRVTAPGKAVITGEYAVLRGAPSIVMAVNRRAVVCTSSSSDVRSTVVTPGFANGKWNFAVAAGNVDWLAGRGPDIIAAVFAALPGLPSGSLDISIDTQSFVDERSAAKLGLGSSAAATTALVAALVDSSCAGAELRQLASAAHRNLQGVAGSGLDIAASCEGGLICFSRDDGIQGRLAWPAALHYRYFFSGAPASTRDAISRVASIPEIDRAWQDLEASASDAALGLTTGDAGSVLAAIAAYGDALQSFDSRHRIGIFSAGHDEMLRLAGKSGLVYKPCGAGGGDIGIAVATDAEKLDAFAALAIDTGFVPLDLQMDNSGVTAEAPQA
jgi:phosphomevalonate kinase